MGSEEISLQIVVIGPYFQYGPGRSDPSWAFTSSEDAMGDGWQGSLLSYIVVKHYCIESPQPCPAVWPPQASVSRAPLFPLHVSGMDRCPINHACRILGERALQKHTSSAFKRQRDFQYVLLTAAGCQRGCLASQSEPSVAANAEQCLMLDRRHHRTEQGSSAVHTSVGVTNNWHTS